VIHPDYAGLGLGIRLINFTSQHMIDNYPVRVMAKYSSTPVYKAMIKQLCWRYIETKRLMSKMPKGGNLQRRTGFREYGIKTYHFEYIGIKDV
jgi:hypothetical protein